MTGILCTWLPSPISNLISLTDPISTPLNFTGAPMCKPLTEPSK